MAVTDNELLRDEYLALQKSIDDFDGKALTIKAWSVTASVAGLSVAYVEHVWQVLLIASASAVVFWFVDAMWKVNQRVYYPRMHQIEGHFAGTAQPTKPFQVSRLRREVNIARPKFRRTLLVMFEPVVAFPHAAVAIAGLLLLVLVPPLPKPAELPSCAPERVHSPALPPRI